LYWNDTPGTLASQKSTGPAIALEVQPGDTIRAEAFARYEEKESYSHTGITLSLLSTMLGNTFAFAPGIDGATPTQVSEWFNGALSAPDFLNYTDETVHPNAYLSYIVFDANMVAIANYAHREPVSVEAAFAPGEEVVHGAHERVYLHHPVIIPAGGKYIYVWVSNESPETRVWFDDFSVTHTTSYVSHATDYGVWGDVLRTTSTEPAAPAALRKNLKAQYAFSGNAQDQSGNGINGTVSGAVLTTGVDGEANKAYSFNGVNNYIKLEGSADKLSFVQNTGVFTIAAYIKLNDLNARSAIVSSTASGSQKGFAFVFDTYSGAFGTHALRFSSTRGDGSSVNLGTGTDYAINDTEWHHVAVVGDGSTFRFYIDGQPDGYATAFNSFSSGTSVGDILIGASRTTATNIQLPMNGSIDEVHIFDKALSGSEIRLMAEGASPEQIDQVLQPVNRGYRYQYQGQFAEKDEETGWNHFELREYDAIIGRWMSFDPRRQYYSPYLSVGNNPISNIDPTGGEGGPAWQRPKADDRIHRGVASTLGHVLDTYEISSDYLPPWTRSVWEFAPEPFDRGAGAFGLNMNIGKYGFYNETGEGNKERGAAISMGGELTMADASMDIRAGSRALGLVTGGRGAVVTARANSDIGFFNGERLRTGFIIDVNAGIYGAEGEVYWGVTLGGITIKTVTGASAYTANAGITAGAYYDRASGDFTIEGFGHLGAGFGFLEGVKIVIPVKAYKENKIGL
jgi:RHS repeat-associated protein